MAHQASRSGRTEANTPDPESIVPRASAPSLALPKGGGAIRGLGETFAANPVSGTGATTVPIALSSSRGDFGPELTLGYDSGSGNGPFGFGWSLALPQISRRTDRGVPRYDDDHESDVYLLSGSEDLVPVLDPGASGEGEPREDERDGYVIRFYRPRVEGLFARIERWTRRSDGHIHWRTYTPENTLTVYGRDATSRIADPTAPERVFTWLICESRDDKGNAVLYEYMPEDGAGVDLTTAHERNRGDRDDSRRTANRYLKRIRYGNRVPLLDAAGRRPRFLMPEHIQEADWMFEVVVDYDEGHLSAESVDADGRQFVEASITPTRAWSRRADPFSRYRGGFEVRTARLCHRILMFHHFPDEPDVGEACLVGSTEFSYAPPGPGDAGLNTFLSSVTHAGYRRDNGRYRKCSTPPVEFGYSSPTIDPVLRDVDADNLENLPIGLDGSAYRWVDLHGEGVPGIVTEQGGAWFYKRNLSPITATGGNGPARPEARFAPVEPVASRPNLSLARSRAEFMDLAGDGLPDVVVLDGAMAGLYEHDGADGWQPFRPLIGRFNRDRRRVDVKLVDLDGDGRADVMIREDDALVWHVGLGEEGFGTGFRVPYAADEEHGPRQLSGTRTDGVFLADMSGDGLTDLVRVRNGDVCYWPNLGYGVFGAKVQMDGAPVFDTPDRFDTERIRLADIDGSGTTDLIYLGQDGARAYWNRSGNGWSPAQPLSAFPQVDRLTSVFAVDLLGNGTMCLVWSSPLPGHAGQQMRYLDLMGGRKPHLLVSITNNLGARTRIEYAPSTKFYLQDRRDCRPWATRLPFPVHVVERVETIDAVSGNRFVSRYSYHHGFYDGTEREFGGFGRVDRLDTEEFASFAAGGSPDVTNVDDATHVPPVLSRTWFHTGAWTGHPDLTRRFADEYYREPGGNAAQVDARLLPDTVLPAGLAPAEQREAARALRGTILRTELYALDGTGSADHPYGQPYTVAEQNATVHCLQRRGSNRHAVFFTHPRESLTYHYERDPTDPRIEHELVLETDAFGNALRTLAVGYGRRMSSTDPVLTVADRAAQTRTLLSYTENAVTNAVTTDDDHRTPVTCDTRTYELTGYAPADGGQRFTMEEWTCSGFALLTSAKEIPYEQTADGVSPQRRLVEHVRTQYRADDCTALLPLGELEPLALPGETYGLACTPGLLNAVFVRDRGGVSDRLLPDPSAVLEGTGPDRGGYAAEDGGWWVASGRVYFDPTVDLTDPGDTAARELATARQHFFLPQAVVDPFGAATVIQYDDHDLLPVRTVDPLGNAVSAANDYRVLQPYLITDPNRNRAAAAYDTLGMVTATAVMGKPEEQVGDLLDEFDPDPTLADLQAFAAEPGTAAARLLGNATSRTVYDIDRFRRTGQPGFAAELARETHLHAPGGAQTRIQISVSYSDGFAQEIQTKFQAEPGDAPQRAADVALPGGDIRPGELVRDEAGEIVSVPVARRWVGTGRTVSNNKGDPVRQYEPFFSATHLYEPERDMTDTGVSPVLFYDPVQRVIATLHPNHTYDKAVVGAWEQAAYDPNDTVLTDPREDPHIAGFVRGYFRAQPTDWQTWYAERVAGALGPAEQDAADKAAAHADTPTIGHFDVLGRPFVNVADNGPDPAQPGQHQLFVSRVWMDIEGNRRAVFDTCDRLTARYDYDMLGNPIHQANMEAGERWMLDDAVGNPLRAFDSRGLVRRLTYDALRRPTALFITEDGVERLIERTEYGESQGDSGNHRTQVHRSFDGTGIVTSVGYDFKGNLVQGRRDLLPAYRHTVDWQQDLVADDGTYTSHLAYDALNRPLTTVSPDGTVYRPTFTEANLLDRVDVVLRGAEQDGQPVWTPLVTNVEYNAKGQRERIHYGNGSVTTHKFDPLTLRLSRLVTTRPANPDTTAAGLFVNATVVQDLRYTYDPAGNITRIQDAALKTVFHAGQQVEPVARYTYDAMYRLVEARGREHIAQTALQPGAGRHHPFAGPGAQPNDLQALRTYVESYTYDAAGNLTSMRHTASGGGWTRHYDYEEASLLDTATRSNRLTRTRIGANHVEAYSYDDTPALGATLLGGAHGCLTAINGATLTWDAEDQLHHAELSGGGAAWYMYDGGGQRARKVVESPDGTRRNERIYLGGVEVYREYAADGITITLERETLHVMDDKQRIALVDTVTVDNGAPVPGPTPLTRFQLGNHLGSAVLELDASGALITYEEYHPFGTSAFQSGRSAAEVSLKRYRYTGMERDVETGFAYHGARYYLPWLGRWLSTDPEGIEVSLNLYAYARNCPIRLLDRTGGAPGLHPGYGGGWTYASMPDVFFFDMGPGEYGYMTESGGGIVDNQSMSVIVKSGHPVLMHHDAGVFEVPANLLSPNPGEISSAGTRWNAQGPRQFYQNPKALDLAMAGYTKEAEVWEAGHGCAGCHIERTTNGPVPNSQLDLNRYNSVALMTKVAADIVGIGYDPRNPFTLLRMGLIRPPVTPAPVRPSTPVRPAAPGKPSASPVPSTSIKPTSPPPANPPAKPPAAPLSASQLVSSIERHVTTQSARVATAIRAGDRQFFRNLGMSDKVINILMNPKHRTFAMEYGNAVERAAARAFRSDPRLSKVILDTRNQSGVVFPKAPPGQGRSRRPDFGIRNGDMQGNIIDVTTRGNRAAKMDKYHDRVITIEYDRPTF